MHSVAQNNTHYQDLFSTNITFFFTKSNNSHARKRYITTEIRV